MVQQRYGHDEGDKPLAVPLDDLEQLSLLVPGEELLEVAHPVKEHVGVLGARGLEAESLHEERAVLGVKPLGTPE